MHITSSANGEAGNVSVKITSSVGKNIWDIVIGITSDLKLITVGALFSPYMPVCIPANDTY
jgi:hypothetical protein